MIRRFQELLFLSTTLAVACSGEPDGPQSEGFGVNPIAGGGSGGALGTAGSSATAIGGVGAGGMVTGGTNTGGSTTGGTNTGSMATSGNSTGGSNAGGAATNTGDASTGGASTGESTTSGGSSTNESTTGDASSTDGTDTQSGGETTSAGETTTGDSSGDGSGGSGDIGRSSGCGQMRTLMNGRKTIQSGGNREYILRVPDNYDNNKPYRLIFAFHWLNGNATQVAEGGNGGSTDDPFYGLWDLADNSTIFVAPEGLNAGWANNGGQDVTLTDAILEAVQDDLCIDTTRIFSTGFSYGGGMSFALACARADVFRGVVLYAGAQLSGCSGGDTPIAYMHVHGVADSVLSVDQGRQLRDRYVSVNGCTPQDPQDAARGSGSHTCTSYEGCMEGYPVRWCTHGGDHNPTEKDNGQGKSWVPDEAWSFISQF